MTDASRHLATDCTDWRGEGVAPSSDPFCHRPTISADAASARRRADLSAALALVAAGNCNALRRVYHATSPKLFGICLRICQDYEAAEDVLQKVYLKVWNSAGRFDAERASPITWLCAIARNTAIDWRRANRGAPLLPMHAAAMVADNSPLASDMIEKSQQLDRIFECIDALDERPRQAIRAAFFDGHSYAQLAEIMLVPEGTMKCWIRKGLVQLRAGLGDL